MGKRKGRQKREKRELDGRNKGSKDMRKGFVIFLTPKPRSRSPLNHDNASFAYECYIIKCSCSKPTPWS